MSKTLTEWRKFTFSTSWKVYKSLLGFPSLVFTLTDNSYIEFSEISCMHTEPAIHSIKNGTEKELKICNILNMQPIFSHDHVFFYLFYFTFLCFCKKIYFLQVSMAGTNWKANLFVPTFSVIIFFSTILNLFRVIYDPSGVYRSNILVFCVRFNYTVVNQLLCCFSTFLPYLYFTCRFSLSSFHSHSRHIPLHTLFKLTRT